MSSALLGPCNFVHASPKHFQGRLKDPPGTSKVVRKTSKMKTHQIIKKNNWNKLKRKQKKRKLWNLGVHKVWWALDQTNKCLFHFWDGPGLPPSLPFAARTPSEAAPWCPRTSPSVPKNLPGCPSTALSAPTTRKAYSESPVSMPFIFNLYSPKIMARKAIASLCANAQSNTPIAWFIPALSGKNGSWASWMLMLNCSKLCAESFVWSALAGKNSYYLGLFKTKYWKRLNTRIVVAHLFVTSFHATRLKKQEGD